MKLNNLLSCLDIQFEFYFFKFHGLFRVAQCLKIGYELTLGFTCCAEIPVEWLKAASRLSMILVCY